MPAQNELHPALQFLKDNVVVVGILAVLVISIGAFAISQASASNSQPAPTPAAPEVSAVPLDTTLPGQGESPSAGASPSATSSPAPTSTGNPARGDAPVVGPAAGGTAAPEIVAGGAQQAVTAQSWRPAAEAFAAAWANPAEGKDAWSARLKPHSTPALASTFAYTDIRNVPTDKLVSVSTVREESGTVSFNAVYEEGGTRFQGLAILRPDGSWLVDKVGAPEKK